MCLHLYVSKLPTHPTGLCEGDGHTYKHIATLLTTSNMARNANCVLLIIIDTLPFSPLQKEKKRIEKQNVLSCACWNFRKMPHAHTQSRTHKQKHVQQKLSFCLFMKLHCVLCYVSCCAFLHIWSVNESHSFFNIPSVAVVALASAITK